MAKLVTNNYKPEDVKPVRDLIERPPIVPKDYHTAVVDNRQDRLDTLLQYADGAKAKVIYFKQRLGSSESPTAFDAELSGAHQQYERIDGLELLLQGGLEVSTRPDNIKTTEIRGTAHLRAPVIPNVGDIFLMDFGRGTLGWFSIYETTRLSHRKNTLYSIEFILAYNIHDQVNDPRMINLNSKVVEVFKYSLEYLKAGNNPLLTPKQAEDFEWFHKKYHQLKNYWFKTFYTRYHETCFVPNQTKLTYDGFFMSAIAKWFSASNTKEMTLFRVYEDGFSPTLKTPSVWDLITQREDYLYSKIFTEAVTIDRESFHLFPKLGSIRYSGFDRIVAPTTAVYTNEQYLKNQDKVGEAKLMSNSVNYFESFVYQDIVLVHPIQLDKSYVFSKHFYFDDAQGKSHIELQLEKYIEGNYLDADVLKELVEHSYHWGELEQYYYIPVILILVDYLIQKGH